MVADLFAASVIKLIFWEPIEQKHVCNQFKIQLLNVLTVD